MENDATVPDLTADDALAHVQAGRAAAARRVATPWWYHPAIGVALALLLAALTLRGTAQAVLLGLALVAEAALLALYRRLTGLWVNTWHVEGMRRVTAVATAASAGVVGLGVALEQGSDVRGAAAVAGLVLGAGYVGYWRWVERRLAALWTAAP